MEYLFMISKILSVFIMIIGIGGVVVWFMLIGENPDIEAKKNLYKTIRGRYK